jgi:hypothetical protein
MTLREALMSVDFDDVYQIINKKDNSNFAKNNRPTLEQTIGAYQPVVKELLHKPKTKAYSLSWLVEECQNPGEKIKYIGVCFLNPKYVAPAKGLKPWGGKNPPKGHYNCNLNKHNRTFATGWTPWSKIIDTPIIITAPKCSREQAVAEILWEMTFYGWSEEKVNTQVSVINDKIKKAEKEIKEGKCVKLPPKKKGGMSIVIPDSVSQFLIDLANKKK